MGDDEFWIATLALATAYVTTFALAFFAAAGMITFTSENRSTPLRICMLVQQAAWIGWMGYAWIQSDFRHEVLLIMVMMAGMYWYGMGTLLTAERPEMSQRMRRRLPTTLVGACVSHVAESGTGERLHVRGRQCHGDRHHLRFGNDRGVELPATAAGGWPGGEELFFLLVIGWGYLVAYLGLGMLIVVGRAAGRPGDDAGQRADSLSAWCLAGSGIPTVIQLMSAELRYVDYSYLQITNPFWSLVHIADGGT